MTQYAIEDAAKLAEASYHAAHIIRPRIMHACPDADVQAYFLEDATLLLPGSNSVTDYMRFNLRPLRLGHKRITLNDDTTAKGTSGTTWHQGFLLYASVIADWLIKERVAPKYIIGHSLGAAAAQVLCKTYGIPGIAFAAPRPKHTPNTVNSGSKCLLINRQDDMVPKLPVTFFHLGQVKTLAPQTKRAFPAHKMNHYRDIVEKGLASGALPTHWSGE